MSQNWPGAASQRLFTADFTLKSGATSTAHVNFSASSTAAGWTFVSTPVRITPNASPTIGSVVVVEATGPRNGTLTTSEKVLMTWNAADADGLAKATLQVDGKKMTVWGPYATATGANFAGVAGHAVGGHPSLLDRCHRQDRQPVVGLHRFVQRGGGAGNVGPTIGGVVAVPSRQVMTWNAQDSNGVASASLTVDGKAAKVYGPYAAASGVNFSGVLGALSVGSHKYTITATDKLGKSSQYDGTLFVGAALTIDASTAPQGSPALLTDQQLAPLVAEAERRLAATSGMQVLAAMAGIKVQVADLSGGLLGEAVGKTILIDRDAAGYGWFVDPTPADDLEFADKLAPHTLAARNGSAAANRVDLLTAVMHEMEHVLGHGHSNSLDLMYPTLSLGTRRSARA